MAENDRIVIKKYPNRRLYNTKTSKYITLDDLTEYVKNDKEFLVLDVKTNEDITRITLTQIILDHELKGYSLLPIEMVKLMIKFYDHPLSKAFQGMILQNVSMFDEYAKKISLNNDAFQQFNHDIQNNLNQFKEMGEAFMNIWSIGDKKSKKK